MTIQTKEKTKAELSLKSAYPIIKVVNKCGSWRAYYKFKNHQNKIGSRPYYRRANQVKDKFMHITPSTSSAESLAPNATILSASPCMKM